MIERAVKDFFKIKLQSKAAKLSTGIINHTYKIEEEGGKSYLLQQINTTVFHEPDFVQQNYLILQKYLQERNSFKIPEIIKGENEELLYKKNNQVWRCFEFISDTYSPSTSSNADEAWKVANCFGKFSADLSDLQPSLIKVILPEFHNLELRYKQLLQSLKTAEANKLHEAKALIDLATKNDYLVDFYKKISDSKELFRLHILHHDCKIANILFKKQTGEIYCPIDLDTTQPGLFFSDLGDMIRSIVPNLSENETNFGDMELRKDFYEAVKDGYLQSMKNNLTEQEQININASGKIVIYMQALRFLTDYLNNNIYYQVKYPEQNKDRAQNQFQLLSLLGNFVKEIAVKKNYYI